MNDPAQQAESRAPSRKFRVILGYYGRGPYSDVYGSQVVKDCDRPEETLRTAEERQRRSSSALGIPVYFDVAVYDDKGKKRTT